MTGIAGLALLSLLMSGSDISPSTFSAVPAQTTKRAASPVTTRLSISVTDGTGAPLSGVAVTASGVITREGETDANGSVRFEGLRSGTYRFRFARDGFTTLERDVTIPPRQPAMEQNVTLSTAPPRPVAVPPPPPPPEPARGASLPPPGKPAMMSMPDFIERNFISGKEPQRESVVGCSGLLKAMVWQIREPWENRQHAGEDAMLYVIGGEGTLRLGSRDTMVQAGSFAVVPRGASYSLSRRGRNPLIVLTTFAGEGCAP